MTEPHELSREIADVAAKYTAANTHIYPMTGHTLAPIIDPLVTPIIERAEKAEADNQDSIEVLLQVQKEKYALEADNQRLREIVDLADQLVNGGLDTPEKRFDPVQVMHEIKLRIAALEATP